MRNDKQILFIETQFPLPQFEGMAEPYNNPVILHEFKPGCKRDTGVRYKDALCDMPGEKPKKKRRKKTAV